MTPDQFWSIIAGIVFWVIIAVFFFHQRWCKAKGVKPKPAFNRFKKHEKRISKWTDIFVVAVIFLATFSHGKSLFSDFVRSLSETDPRTKEVLVKNSITFSFLTTFFFSISVVIMASWLSPFHQNITLKKRLILTVMCCVPLVFGILYCVFDDTRNYRFYSKLLLGGLFPVLFFNGPAIFLGKSLAELIMPLCNKIRSWLGFPVQEEMKEQ